MTAAEPADYKVSSWNRQTYQRLKLALSLGLRRQLFVAVCDDLSLRNRLAGQLHTELGKTLARAPGDRQDYPKLVSLNLNIHNPHPLGQIRQWLAQNRQFDRLTPVPGFQILGVERLTRQPLTTQQLFLRRLQVIERYLPRWEATLLLWLPRPWFYTIQQSVPGFWQWHTGFFEFEGEPTPLPPVGASQPEASPVSLTSDVITGSFKDDLQRLLVQDLAEDEEQASVATTLQETTGQGIAVPPLDWQEEEEEQELESDEMMETLASQHSNAQSPQPIQDTQEDAQQEQAVPAEALLDVYLQLGNYYRHVIEQGDASEDNLSIAIQAYEQALQFLEESSPQIPDILNDIGNLYWMLSRCPGSGENAVSYLEQSIQAYQLALTKLTAQEAPQTYAMIQNNLGAAYGDLARYIDTNQNLELSIRAYEEALLYRPAQSDPMKYASTQNNLGTAYWHLAQHQSPVPNLQAAITAYTEALSYYDTQSQPLSWAMIQNNLGTAYWNLAQYEPSQTWLQLAILAYQQALTYRTPDVMPTACAATQNNLGTAYWHLADRFQEEPEQQEQYLQQCIVTYESALALVEELSQQTPPIPVNFDVIATRNNLGLAHYQLATVSQFSLDEAAKSAHLDAALQQHIKACTGVAAQSDTYQTAVNYMIKIIRAIYQERGIAGQNQALSQVPGQLLPEILPRL